MIRQGITVAIAPLALFSALVQMAGAQSPPVPVKQAGINLADLPHSKRFVSKEMELRQQILQALEQEIDVKVLQAKPQIKFRDILKLLTSQVKVNGQPIGILVDKQAFIAENPEADDVLNTDVGFQDFPERMKAVVILRLAVSQLPTHDGTFFVGRGHLEITTSKLGDFPSRLEQKVYVSFENMSSFHLGQTLIKKNITLSFDKAALGEALLDWAARSGISLRLDPGADEKLKMPITAEFSDVTLESLLKQLSSRAGLKIVIVKDGVYVTTPERAAALQARQKAVEPAQEKKPRTPEK